LIRCYSYILLIIVIYEYIFGLSIYLLYIQYIIYIEYIIESQGFFGKYFLTKKQKEKKAHRIKSMSLEDSCLARVMN